MTLVPTSTAYACSWTLLGLLAGSTVYAEEREFGPDLVVMSYGLELEGRIVSEERESVVLSSDGTEVRLERARIKRIEIGGGHRRRIRLMPATQDIPATASRQAPQAAWLWDVSANLSAGVHRGSVTGSGTLTDTTGPTTAALNSTFKTDRFDASPGLGVRLTASPDRLGWQPVFGAEVAMTSPHGAGLSIQQYSAEMIGGARWTSPAALTVDGVLGVGWSLARTTRELELRSSGGALLERVDATANLAGLQLRGEVAVSRRLGSWHVGGALGATWSRLDGTSEWQSASGTLRGNEDVSAPLTGIYAALRAAIDL